MMKLCCYRLASKCVGVFFVIVLFPVVLAFVDVDVDVDGTVLVSPLPAKVASAELTEAVLTDWRPVYKGADAEFAGYYLYKGTRYDAFRAGYVAQEQSKELIYVKNHIYDSTRWGLRSVKLLNHKLGDLKHVSLGSSLGEARQVIYVYIVGGRVTGNDILAKIYQVLAYLEGRQDASVVALSAKVSPEVVGSQSSEFTQFTQAFFNSISLR